MAIQFKVGLKAPNRSVDVRRIQRLLNQARRSFPRIHSEFKPLAEDGLCGKQTLEAIKVFQKEIMGFTYPDQVVDPGGKTWKKLNGNVPAVDALSVKASEWSCSSIQMWLNELIPQSVIDQYHEVERQLTRLSTLPSPIPSGAGSDKSRSITVFRQGDAR